MFPFMFEIILFKEINFCFFFAQQTELSWKPIALMMVIK